jgi:hypothetical protein
MGVSDISDYFSRFITFASNTAINRLVSISKTPEMAHKVGLLASSLFEILPDEIHLPHSPLYVEGLL